MRYLKINLTLGIIFLFGVAIILRLVFLQIVNYDFYAALAKGQQKFFIHTLGERGEIFLQDKEGTLYPIATNKVGYLVYISPNEIKNSKEEVAEKLSQILNLDKEEILVKLKKNSLYELVKNKLEDAEVKILKEINLPGVYLGKEILRYYPHKDFFSKAIGFVGGEKSGQYGLEQYWEKTLRGKSINIVDEKGFGRPLFLALKENRGSDLILTIDYNIQYQAEKLLQKAKTLFNIEEGEVIVIDPVSGKVHALAIFPGYDPNIYEQYAKEQNLEIFQLDAIQKFFEPGSIFKPITMAAALDLGRITPETTYVDEGKVKIGGFPIYNYDGRVWGKRTMTEVLEKSINTGAVFVEKKIGHKNFLDYLDRFGIFKPTEIDLFGETFSENIEFKKGYEINFATASFGQGIEMTSIQLVRAFCAIANGGRLIKPYLVEKIVKGDSIIEQYPEQNLNNIISSETSSKLTAMLVSVVENGFAKRARIPGYYVAGKTGTAQIPWSALGIQKPGYSEQTIQSFIGYLPAFDPRFLILIKLKNPETKTAEYSAVPLFRDLAKYIIDYWQIPPNYSI